MGRLFGTDGVRGLANADLSPELAMSVAVAAAHVLAEADRSHAPLAVVGRDPRASGEMLEAAVVAGLASAGATVVRVGVLPTPGVAFLTAEANADLGVMLSASHNPMPDNGIKLFAAGGHKLPRRGRGPDRGGRGRAGRLAPPDRRRHRPGARPARRGRALRQAPGRRDRRTALDGLKVVVDCANGAASEVAPEVYREAGAEVIAINAEPDGHNINDGCGSSTWTLRAGGARARRRPRHRPRRRRRPVPGRERRRRRWSTATRSWRSSRWACARPAR